MSTQLATVPDVKSAELATLVASPDTRQQLVCKDMLRGDSPQQAQADAAKAYQQMLANPLAVATYGSDALSGLNNLVERMFKQINAGKDPEVAQMIKGLTKSLDTIQHKYNASDPKFVAKYEELRGGFLGFIGGAGAFWRAFLRDVQSIQTQIEKAKDTIDKNLESTKGIISNYEVLYQENKAELSEVIFQIAVMEYIVDLATKDVASIPEGDDHDSSEERGLRADLIKNLQNRISAYKSRLFLGWTTSPQLRAQVSLNTGLYGTISYTKDITFPNMMMVMVQMAQLRKSQNIAQQIEAFRNMANVAIQQFAVNAAVIIPETERIVSAPILAAKTIEVMRDAYVQQTEGVIKVLQEAHEQNAVLEDLYQKTATVFNSQSEKVSDAVIDRAVEATQKLETSTKALAA